MIAGLVGPPVLAGGYSLALAIAESWNLVGPVALALVTSFVVGLILVLAGTLAFSQISRH